MGGFDGKLKCWLILEWGGGFGFHSERRWMQVSWSGSKVESKSWSGFMKSVGRTVTIEMDGFGRESVQNGC